MGRTYISERLIPEQTLLQYMTFHELVELLKFNQCVFAQAGSAQHKTLLRTASRLRRQRPPQADAALPAPPAAPSRLKRHIALQWWGPAGGRAQAAPLPHDRQAPQIGVLSTVQALCNALSLGDHDLYISEASGGQAGATRDIAVFCMFADVRPAAGEDEWRLLADIRELLTGIVVPADAPPRFQELVRKVVQEHLWIPVRTWA